MVTSMVYSKNIIKGDITRYVTSDNQNGVYISTYTTYSDVYRTISINRHNNNYMFVLGPNNYDL